jgi:hypothetical protein
MSKTKKEVQPIPTEPQLTSAEISRAATNSPALSLEEFNLGDRNFKIVDLSYDSYVEFLTLLSPLIESVFGSIASASGIPGVNVDANAFNVSSIIKHCAKTLPQLVQLICNQTEDISVDEVKRLGKTPMVLGGVVLKQLQRNNIIKDFADFFAQALPVLKANLPKKN